LGVEGENEDPPELNRGKGRGDSKGPILYGKKKVKDFHKKPNV